MKRIFALIFTCALFFSITTFAANTTISGRITDATNGKPVQGARVTVGERFTLADANGEYQLADIHSTQILANFSADKIVGDAPLTVQFYDSSKTGYQTVIISAEGYFTAEKKLQIKDQGEMALDISLSPIITDAEYRFVLNWAEQPADLDLSLYVGRTADYAATTISWSEKGELDKHPFAFLDIDVVEGYGPETITLQSLLQTNYLLYVGNFSGEALLSESNAVVRIYNSDGLIHTVNVPTIGNGTFWNICEIDGNSKELTILNQLTEMHPVSGLAKSAAQKHLASEITSWQWDFDSDGTIDATEQHPVFTFYESGIYDVTLYVSNEDQTEMVTKTDFIAVRDNTSILQGLNVHPTRIDVSEFPLVSVQLAVQDSLGNIPNLAAENITLHETGSLAQIAALTQLNGTQTSAADIVFVIDASSSMQRVAQIEHQLDTLVDSLLAASVMPRFALVSFADWVMDFYDFTPDVDLFKTWLQGINYVDGGDDKENALQALHDASQLEFRASAQKIAILVTDADYHVAGELGDGETDFTTDSMIEFLKEQHLTPFIFAPSLTNMYTLAEKSGGMYFSVFSDYASAFQRIVSAMTHQYILSFHSNLDQNLNQWRDIYIAVESGENGGTCSTQYFASASSLVMNPPSMYGIQGKKVSIDLLLKNTVDFSGAHLFISYDPRKYTAVSVTAGEFLGQGDATVAFIENIDADRGVIEISTSRLADSGESGVSGSGVLAKLVFQTRVEDSDAIFDFAQAEFVHSNGNDYPIESRPATIYSIRDRGVSTLIGDFDKDLDIDTQDFAILTTYWSPVDMPLGDIGPAVGPPPILSIMPDNFVNYKDLFTFTRMWNWYHSALLTTSSETLGKTNAKVGLDVKYVGDRVHVSVYAGHVQRLGMGHLTLAVAQQDLELLDVRAGDLFENLTNVALLSNQNEYECDISFTKLSSLGQLAFVSGSGKLVEMVFKSKSENTTRISLQQLDFRTPENLALQTTTEVAEFSNVVLPQEFVLQNYPNPFNGNTRIQYTVPQTGRVTLSVLNMLGQTVRTLTDNIQQAGDYDVQWNCRDDSGTPVSTGVYMLRIVAQDQSLSKKILYLR